MTPTDTFHVLLVEDDDDYSRMLQMELATPRRLPLSLRRVSNLTNALSQVQAEPFDAILLDLGLPDSSGLDTLLRMREGAPDVPIVVLTSHDDDELAVAAVQGGAQDYVVKSSTDGKLLTRSLRYACERNEARRVLQATEDQLRQAQKLEAIGRLAGGVAHDFNNVLTAIFGYTDLLLEQLEPEDPRRSDVQEIRRSAHRAASLTRQLLAFSRKQPIEPRVIDLNGIIRDVAPMLQTLVIDDVKLVFEPADALRTICADPGQVEQVLINLCVNARDAMPEGGRLAIATRNADLGPGDIANRPGLQPGRYALIEVADTGQGIPSELMPHIFEPFFTTKGEGQGTGLGLATVYGIVRQSGGGVYAESEQGKGTTFSVYFPEADGERSIKDAGR